MSNTARNLFAAIVMTAGLAVAATASAHAPRPVVARPIVAHPHPGTGINRHEAARIRYQVHEHRRMQRRAAADGQVSRREHAVLARDAAQVRHLVQAEPAQTERRSTGFAHVRCSIEAPAVGEGVVLPASKDETTRALNGFLMEVERKAYRMAKVALRHDEDALDAVQDAMIQLTRRYADRPQPEWRPLFYRILENRIRDTQRRRTVRGRVMAWMPWSADQDEQMPDPLEQAPDLTPGPAAEAEGEQIMVALQVALQKLPARQRECFMLRSLEGMDVAETAAAMGCSDGSVKTHYSRAVQSLREQLGEFWT